MDCEQFLKVSSYYSKHLIKQLSDSKLRPVGAIAINTNTVTSSIYVILVENREIVTLRLKQSDYENI